MSGSKEVFREPQNEAEKIAQSIEVTSFAGDAKMYLGPVLKKIEDLEVSLDRAAQGEGVDFTEGSPVSGARERLDATRRIIESFIRALKELEGPQDPM